MPAVADDGSGMMQGMVVPLSESSHDSGAKAPAFQKGCGINAVKQSGFQNKDDNEFLYESESVYDMVSDENGTYLNLPGRVWECDDEYCTDQTVVQAPAGHYFKGIKHTKANWYRCWQDEWYPFACGEGYISFDGTQQATDNEFLYSDKASFEAAQKASQLGQDGVEVSGQVWECDNSHCLRRSTKSMPAGHYFKGQRIDHPVEYRCYIGEEDRWEPVVQNVAKTCGETYISFDGTQGAKDNEFLYSNKAAYDKASDAHRLGQDGADNLGGLVYECDNDHCNNGMIQHMSQGHVFEGVVVQEKRSYLCKSNIAGEDRWVLALDLDDGNAGGTQPVKKTCREKRGTVIGKACCDVPGQEASYDALNDKCICNGNKDFVIENERGVCKPRGGTVVSVECPAGSSEAYITNESCIGKGTFECTLTSNDGVTCLCGKCVPEEDGGNDEIVTPFECDAFLLAQINKWEQECSDDTKYASILSIIMRIKEYCTDPNRNQTGFETLYNSLLLLNPEQCAENMIAVIGYATGQVQSAVSDLQGLVSTLEVKKWKSAEGKFNTARLASDSIAGVVLGTAGGLITSNVVKKHQVKEGFEDLKCTIGGQTVASYGDEFMVGVQ